MLIRVLRYFMYAVIPDNMSKANRIPAIILVLLFVLVYLVIVDAKILVAMNISCL